MCNALKRRVALQSATPFWSNHEANEATLPGNARHILEEGASF